VIFSIHRICSSQFIWEVLWSCLNLETPAFYLKNPALQDSYRIMGFSLLSEMEFFVVPKNGISLNKQPPAMRVRVDCYTKKLPFILQ